MERTEQRQDKTRLEWWDDAFACFSYISFLTVHSGESSSLSAFSSTLEESAVVAETLFAVEAEAEVAEEDDAARKRFLFFAADTVSLFFSKSFASPLLSFFFPE